MADSLVPGLDRFRRLSKEGAWIVLGQVTAVLGSLASVRLLTELLDPAAYGELALGMTVAAVMNQTLLGPLGNGVTRFYAPAQERGDLGGYLNAVRHLLSSTTAIMVLMILLTVAGLLLAGRAQWIGIAAAALLFAALAGYNGILSGIQNAARQRAIVALHLGLESWLRLLVAASLLLWLGATSATAMGGFALAALLVLGSQYFFFRKFIPTKAAIAHDQLRWQGKIWAYSWPFAAWGTFTWAQQASDRWALGLFANTQEVGLYAALFQLGYYPMSMVAEAAMRFLGPIFYQRAGEAGDSLRNENVSALSRRLTKLTLVLTGVAFLIALLFHAQIFHLLVAKAYSKASYLLPWMLLAGGIFSAGQTIALDLMSRMKTRSMIVAKIGTALLGILFNLAGAYFLGLEGIVIAVLLFSVVSSVWLAAISRRSTARSGVR